MKRLPNSKAIEPTEVIKSKPGERFEVNMPDANPDADRTFNPPYYVGPGLYHLVRVNRGCWADPRTCIHHRKTFKTRWVCSDCGTELP